MTNLLYPAIMLIAGIGIPIMAVLNSGLAIKLESSALATVILFFVALIISTAYLIKVNGLNASSFRANIPWYFYLGGVLVAFYLFSVTWISPKFGVGNAISFVLLGQLIALSVIDHFGLLGAPQYVLDGKRALGLIMMIIGVFLVVKRQASS